MTANLHDDQRFEALYDAIFSVGCNFMQQGKFDKALIIFDGLMALEPSQRKAALAYGETLLLANRAKKPSIIFSLCRNNRRRWSHADSYRQSSCVARQT